MFDYKTLLQQIGGTARLSMMVGAKDFVRGDNYVAFKIGKGPTKINYVKIEYDYGRDLYNMVFSRVKRGSIDVEVIATVDGVYGDGLMDMFEYQTGLFLTLSRRN